MAIKNIENIVSMESGELAIKNIKSIESVGRGMVSHKEHEERRE